MMDSSTAPGGTGRAPGTHKEEPDLWHEDDIPTDDAGEDGQARDTSTGGRSRETPDRQTDSPRE